MNKADFERKYAKELTFDLPLDYKGLSFKPVLLRDYFEFFDCAGVLFVERSSFGAEFLTMPLLKFLLMAAIGENDVIIKLKRLFHVTCGADCDFLFDGGGKAVFTANGQTFTSGDFKKIREITAFQNGLDLDGDVKDVNIIQAGKEKSSALDNGRAASFEDLIVRVAAVNSVPLKEMYDLPIRKFNMYLKAANARIEYVICRLAESYGALFKSKIPHWTEGALDAETLEAT